MRETPKYCFSCEDCEHYAYGKCEYGFELVEPHEDAYDCSRFEDKYPLGR